MSLPDILIQSDHGKLLVSEHGAQTLSWQTVDGREQLYLSPRAVMDGKAAIRGGVPICFPQFNMRVLSANPLPKHGLARSMPWVFARRDAQSLRMELSSSTQTMALWPHAFSAGLDVELDVRSLRICFDVTNTGQQAFPFALALHTYLHVSDIYEAKLRGLEGCAYWDAVKHAKELMARRKDDEPLMFGLETDRVYANAPRQMVLQDSQRIRRITQSESLPDTVVWNPGEALCAQLPDMPAQGWREMLCVEAACIEQPVILQAGERWHGWQKIELQA